jgi:sugar-specific transcriptional regulator TrmB
MIIKELIKSLGLSNYETEVYNALLKVEKAKVQELVKMVSVPRPMIYASLKKLVNRGICIENKGKINYYLAVAPSVAFQNILHNEEETLRAKIKGVQELNGVYKKRKKEEIPYEFVEVLKGRQIKQSIKNLLDEAKKEILIFFRLPTERNEKEMEDSVKFEISVLRKGIKVRCLYDKINIDSHETDWILPYLRKVSNQGEEGRVIKHLPINMLIVDEKAATFSLTHREEKDETVFLFNHPALIAVMKYAFEYQWTKSINIKEVLNKKKKK